MTAKANAPKSPAALAAAHLARCEAVAAASQAKIIEAQTKAVAAAPRVRPIEEARALIAAAAANDAVRGTRDAILLAQQFEHERREAAEAEKAHRQAEAEVRALADSHAQANADLAAAIQAMDAIVASEATRIAEEARKTYGRALQDLVSAHERWMVASTAARGGVILNDLPLPASLPTLGQYVASNVATANNAHVYWDAQVVYPTVHSLSQALRRRLASGGEE